MMRKQRSRALQATPLRATSPGVVTEQEDCAPYAQRWDGVESIP
jgi:hypothetical protein